MRRCRAIATQVSSNPESYVYLAESIRAWPDQSGLALAWSKAGWGKVDWHNLSGGIVACTAPSSPDGRAKLSSDLSYKPRASGVGCDSWSRCEAIHKRTSMTTTPVPAREVP